MGQRRVFVTGTDTDAGKTVASAALAAVWQATYWKPVQAGRDPATDRDTVARLAGVPTLPERWSLRRPASPHAASEDEGVVLDVTTLRAPDGPLVVEGAGGWEVPFRRTPLQRTADLVRALDLPVVIVARSGLGTLNHTTLTARAVAADGFRAVGLLLVGEPHPDNERDLPWLTGLPVWARLDRVALPNGFPALVAQLRAALTATGLDEGLPDDAR